MGLSAPLRRRPKRFLVALLVVAIALAGALVIGILALVLGGPQFPAVGVGLSGQAPAVYFKLCHGRAVGRLVLGQVDRSVPLFKAQTVWSAVLDERSRARQELPITTGILGYRVSSTLPHGLPLEGPTYVVTDATDQNHTNILEAVITFRVGELREGFIASNGTTMSASRWLGPNGPACH